MWTPFVPVSPHFTPAMASIPFRRPHLSAALLLAASAFPALAADPAATTATPVDEGVAFFEKKIRPLLVEQCYNCHSADTKAAGDLRVDDRNGLLMGGNGGPAVVPGDPEKSLLIQRLNHADPKRRMPRESDPLTEAQVADLTTWIRDGAAWPTEKIPGDLGKLSAKYAELKEKHWAWQPIVRPAVPAVADPSWPRSDIDRFVLAGLEQAKLPPVADAAPLTLIRRLTFDLTGLPPEPERIAAFLQDPSPEAYQKEVDRLLDSPAFGERWGRHWLDIARYGESTGPSRNIPYPHAWKYRDYVLDAVNRDIPFDRFIQEQIAGDLLPAAADSERDRLLTATGFLALGVKDVNQRFKTRFVMDNVDEQIDTVTRSVLGLTVSCARCHDHKFDPIPTTDYYSLAGIFTSTDDCAGVRNKMGGGGLDYYNPAMLVKLSTQLAPPPAEEVAKLQVQVDAAKKDWDEIRGTPRGLARAANGQPTQRPFRLKYERLQAELQALTDPAVRGEAVHGVREAATIADTEVRIRGEAERLGPKVPRGFLTTFEVPGASPVNPAQSGRLELARWLTSPHNPLTPRVIVNRVWQHLFGQGIVTTVDNFGVTGDTPSHPELLDHLASGFVEDGWSVKRLVRTLVLTRAYQLGSEVPALHRERDPGNRLIWRHSPRRLDAEEIRDAILASAGSLQPVPSGEPAVKKLRMVEMRDNGAEARAVHERADRELARSIYLPLLRGVIPKSLEAFDPVTQSLVTGRRDATTVPTQALFLLNSAFVREQSLAFARREVGREGSSDDDRIREIYRRTLGRPPELSEEVRAREFLADFESSDAEEAQPQLAASDDTPPEASTSEAPATTTTADANGAATANPDDIARDDQLARDRTVVAEDPRTEAWLNLIQALYASAEFRFVR